MILCIHRPNTLLVQCAMQIKSFTLLTLEIISFYFCLSGLPTYCWSDLLICLHNVSASFQRDLMKHVCTLEILWYTSTSNARIAQVEGFSARNAPQQVSEYKRYLYKRLSQPVLVLLTCEFKIDIQHVYILCWYHWCTSRCV